jgi:hypothetical protein
LSANRKKAWANLSPETQLLSLIPNALCFPDLVIEVKDKVFHKSSFRFRPEMYLGALQNLSELLPRQPTYSF